MWEILLKTIPFTPILYWIFSKTFRMAKKRKFYDAQISSLEDYIKNHYKNDSIEFSLRDLKARQVTCNDWVGAKFLDYAIEEKCPNIFGAIDDFDKAWVIVKLKNSDSNKIKLVSKYSKKKLKKFFVGLVSTYFFFGGILFLNKFLLILLGIFDIPAIPINATLFDILFFISILFLVISSILLLSVGSWIASLLALSNKLPIEFKLDQTSASSSN